MRKCLTIAAILLASAPAWAQMSGGVGTSSGGVGTSSGGGAGLGGSGGGGSGGNTTGTLDANTGITSGSLLGGFNNVGTGASTGRGSSATAGSATISTNNFLAATYVNVLAQGISSGTGTNATVGKNVAFGAPVYTISTATTGAAGRTGATAGVGGRAGTGTSGSLSTGISFTQGGSIGPAIGRRGPVIGATLRFATSPLPPEQIRGDVQAVLARTSGLSNSGGVTVQHIDGAVVLRGTVANDDERRKIENIAWLTPGVRKIKNELQVP